MKYLTIPLIVILFSCKSGINYPEGGFDYPTNLTGKDTNYYRYPLLNTIPKDHRFAEYFEQYFYKQFEEPNLSIRPLAKETFRLTYSSGVNETIILSFNKNEIIIKKGVPGGTYTWDTTKLTKLENEHLEILRRWFPFETKGNYPRIKRYLDSLSVLYPRLLDVNYYIELYDKVNVRNNEKFTYQTRKIAITEKAFEAIVEEINNSSYWKLSHDIECEDAPAEGYGFTLEANTFRKYKVVSRSGCPSEKTDFPKLCQKIIVFAGLDKDVNLDPEWKTVVVKPDSSSAGIK
jgi:hypothetical protein